MHLFLNKNKRNCIDLKFNKLLYNFKNTIQLFKNNKQFKH